MINLPLQTKMCKSKLLPILLSSKQTLITFCSSNRRRQLWAVWWCYRLPIALDGDKADPICCDHVSLEGSVDGDSPGGRHHIKSPRSLFLSLPLLNTWTLSTELCFAVPLNWGSLVNDQLRSDQQGQQAGDHILSAVTGQRVIVTVTGGWPILWWDCHQSWTYESGKGCTKLMCTDCQRISMTSVTKDNLVSNQEWETHTHEKHIPIPSTKL